MKLLRNLPFILLGLAALGFGVWSGRGLSAFAGRITEGWQPQATRIDKDPQKPVQEPARSGDYPLPDSVKQPTADPTRQPPLPGSKAPGSAAPARQENLLIVGVDSLGSAAPVLKSVWLAVYMADRPHFMLLPVYPSQSASGGIKGPDTTLPAEFSLTTEQMPSSEFLKALEAKDLWWTHYLVLDETVLAILIDQAERRPDSGEIRLGDTLKDVPDPALEPLEALLAQARVAQSLCFSSAHLVAGDPQKIPALYKQIRTHVSTDLNLETALSEWSARLQIGAITCEFPSLATAMLLP